MACPLEEGLIISAAPDPLLRGHWPTRHLEVGRWHQSMHPACQVGMQPDQLVRPQAINKLQYTIHGSAEASNTLEPNQLQGHTMHLGKNRWTGATKEDHVLFFFSVAALLSTVAVKYLLDSQKEIKNQLTSKKATKTSQPNKNQHDKGELK